MVHRAFIVLLLVSVALSFLVAAFWKNRGLDYTIGLLVSLLLTPIPALVIGVLVNPEPRRVQPAARPCPSCAVPDLYQTAVPDGPDDPTVIRPSDVFSANEAVSEASGGSEPRTAPPRTGAARA